MSIISPFVNYSLHNMVVRQVSFYRRILTDWYPARHTPNRVSVERASCLNIAALRFQVNSFITFHTTGVLQLTFTIIQIQSFMNSDHCVTPTSKRPQDNYLKNQHRILTLSRVNLIQLIQNENIALNLSKRYHIFSSFHPIHSKYIQCYHVESITLIDR